MKINSAIRAIFGLTTALGAAAAALPASAATVTVNDQVGTAKGIFDFIKPTGTGNVPVQCEVTFDLGLASDVSVGVHHTVPPQTPLSNITGATFLAGTSYCNTITTAAPQVPWPIQFNAVIGSSMARVTVFLGPFSEPFLGDCEGTYVSGDYIVTSGPVTIVLPPFTMTSTSPGGTVNGTCSFDSTTTLIISAETAPYFSLTYP